MVSLYSWGMFDPAIQDILTKRLQAVPEIILAPSLKNDVDELVAAYMSMGKIAIVDDAHTAEAFGNRVYAALKGRFETAHITLTAHPKADDASLAFIAKRSAKADLLIAVGSGTINDLVKYAAHQAGKPYVLFPTAASMNGYVSKTASLSMNGKKSSLAASLPLAVLIDKQVIADAPASLGLAGLGDALARSTAQSDWLLSHHLLGTAYDDAPFQLTKSLEPLVFEQASAIAKRDAQALISLLTLSLLSGFGMTMAGSSAPASGAEHMIAHAYGMSNAPKARRTLHGEEIALSSVHMAMRQEKLLGGKRPALAQMTPPEVLAKFFSASDIAAFEKDYAKKRASMMSAMPDHRPDAAVWDKAREAVAAIHLSSGKMKEIVAKAGLPAHAGALGWDEEAYEHLTPLARFTRDRFTCLEFE